MLMSWTLQIYTMLSRKKTYRWAAYSTFLMSSGRAQRADSLSPRYATHTHTHMQRRNYPGRPSKSSSKKKLPKLCPFSVPAPAAAPPLTLPLPPTRAHSVHMCKRTQRTCFGPTRWVVESICKFCFFFWSCCHCWKRVKAALLTTEVAPLASYVHSLPHTYVYECVYIWACISIHITEHMYVYSTLPLP